MGEPETVDLRVVTQVQQQIWSQGDFARIGVTTTIVHELLSEAANIRAGERVMDVACGAGTGAIAAARRTWESTVGLDYVPELLERAESAPRPSGSMSSSSRATPRRCRSSTTRLTS